MWTLIALAGPALAQGWTVDPLYVGTDISGNTGDVAAGIALAGSASEGRLYFALVRETPDGVDRTSTLWLGILDCPGWVACPLPTTLQIGSAQLGDGPLPSIAVEDVPGGRPKIHVVHAARHTACAVPVRQIEEHVYDPATGLFESRVVREPDACGDAQLSHTLVADDRSWACWTEDPVTPGFDNQVWCGTRDLLDPAASWTTELLADGASTQDHSWFAVADGLRYTVFRNRDPAPDAIDLHTDLTAGPIGDGNPSQDDDFPSIARAPDGSFHAVWVEARRRISYGKCESGLDCTDPANWVAQPRPVRTYDTGPLDHPEIVISESGRMFVFWTEDHDGSPGDQRRIHVKEKCRNEPMFEAALEPGEVVSDIGNTPVDQTLLLGRPHAWIDEETDTVHLVWLEKDSPGPHPVHGDALRATKPIAPCP